MQSVVFACAWGSAVPNPVPCLFLLLPLRDGSLAGRELVPAEHPHCWWEFGCFLGGPPLAPDVRAVAQRRGVLLLLWPQRLERRHGTPSVFPRGQSLFVVSVSLVNVPGNSTAMIEPILRRVHATGAIVSRPFPLRGLVCIRVLFAPAYSFRILSGFYQTAP